MSDVKMPWNDHGSFLKWLSCESGQAPLFYRLCRSLNSADFSALQRIFSKAVEFGARQAQKQLAAKDAEIERLKAELTSLRCGHR